MKISGEVIGTERIIVGGPQVYAIRVKVNIWGGGELLMDLPKHVADDYVIGRVVEIEVTPHVAARPAKPTRKKAS